MRTIFIIHGVGGHPGENWFPWLKMELEKLGHRVIVPQFPTPEGQTLDNWLKVMNSYEADITADSLIVGHSLGVPFTLNILEKHPMRAAFLVAGFFGKAGNHFDESMKTFAQKSFDWGKIKEHCQDFLVFHSDNDPYIALKKGEELAAQLEVPITFVPGGGHFNSSSGYREKFPLLLEKMKPFLT